MERERERDFIRKGAVGNYLGRLLEYVALSIDTDHEGLGTPVDRIVDQVSVIVIQHKRPHARHTHTHEHHANNARVARP